MTDALVERRRRQVIGLVVFASLLVVMLIVVLLVRDCCGDRVTVIAGGPPVLFEPEDTVGPDPFISLEDRSEVTATPPVAPTPESGIYGGSLENTCDQEMMIAYLLAHPEKGEAWAAVQGLPYAQLPTYIRSLRPAVLAFDTPVTNHGFAGGVAAPRQSMLAAGTAVLVDSAGVPRARCYCGNPLVPPVTVVPSTTTAPVTTEAPATTETPTTTAASDDGTYPVDPSAWCVPTEAKGGTAMLVKEIPAEAVPDLGALLPGTTATGTGRAAQDASGLTWIEVEHAGATGWVSASGLVKGTCVETPTTTTTSTTATTSPTTTTEVSTRVCEGGLGELTPKQLEEFVVVLRDAGFNVVLGTDQNDALFGTGGPDAIFGRGGEDEMDGFEGDDCLFGGPDADLIRDSGGGDDFVAAGAGDDWVLTGDGFDVVYGEDGNDQLDSGLPSGRFEDGGPGLDTCSLIGTSDAVGCEQ